VLVAQPKKREEEEEKKKEGSVLYCTVQYCTVQKTQYSIL
jgi:hypothetical protein